MVFIILFVYIENPPSRLLTLLFLLDLCDQADPR